MRRMAISPRAPPAKRAAVCAHSSTCDADGKSASGRSVWRSTCGVGVTFVALIGLNNTLYQRMRNHVTAVETGYADAFVTVQQGLGVYLACLDVLGQVHWAHLTSDHGTRADADAADEQF